MNVRKQNKCRCCASKKLRELITFGKVPLNSNLIDKSKQKIDKYKLNLLVCLECFHVQIGYLVDPKKLFSKYFWETGVSISNLKLIENLYNVLKERHNLKKKSSIFEIACNDGSLLKYFYKKGNIKTSGIDPAKNLLSEKVKKKYSIINDFFSFKNSKKYFKNQYDFLIARNVLAHVEDPNEIIKGASILSKKGTVLIIEVPHLLTIYNENQYDNIFHEHVGYHSLDSINRIAEKFNFNIVDCEIIESQGNSLRCFYKYGSKKNKNYNNINKIVQLEKKLLKISTWKVFAKKINNHRDLMKKLFNRIKRDGKNISAYGASGKGQSLLQICNLNRKFINYIYDKSELKIGKYLPFGKIKIKNPINIVNDDPDYLLLLSWNLRKEILIQEYQYRKNGGKFIVPFPLPKII